MTVTTDGAALPGVTVTISSPALQGTRTAVTGEGGGYTFPSLPPGTYTVVFELSGMAKVTKTVSVLLASTARADADMKMSSVAEAITVTATAPAVLENTDVARNYSAELISELPVRRNIVDTVLLAPGVNNAGARGNISISGARVVRQPVPRQRRDRQREPARPAARSLHRRRHPGDDRPHRRGLGRVRPLHRRRGQRAHEVGRQRVPRLAPRHVQQRGLDRQDADRDHRSARRDRPGLRRHARRLAWRDRLWFFAAGRDAKGAPAVGINPIGSTTAPAGQPVTTFSNTVDEKRYEVQAHRRRSSPQHSIVGSYLDVDKVETNNFFAPIYDTASIVAIRSLPNTLLAVSYNGVLTSNLLVEGQYSKKEFAFIGSGGVFTDRIKGTWIQDTDAPAGTRRSSAASARRKTRDNDSIVAKATYFVNTKSLGTHNFVAAPRTTTRPAASTITSPPASTRSSPPARPRSSTALRIPRFDTATRLRYRPILTLSQGSDMKTRAFFVNDKWDFNNHWNFNVGVRYDKNDAVDASGNVVSDDSAFSPRLGVMYDIKGDGRYRVNASYSHYVTKIVDGNVGGGAAGAGVPGALQLPL